ncbi:MAG: efflux transporter periplasmic adaptor subunit, partial [Bacteroidota bacterium]
DEGLLRFDAENDDKPYVEIETGEQKFEKRFIEVGISDGKNIEIKSGLKEEDKIKIWNKFAIKKDSQQNTGEDGESEEEGEANQ